MITEINYVCEICRHRYRDAEDAVACEAKGRFNPEKYPQGLMFQYEHNGYVGIFAVPALPTKAVYEHYDHEMWWACRVGGNDSLGEQMCGHGYRYSDEEHFKRWVEYGLIRDEHLNGPEFNRMVTYLKSVGIRPHYYNKDMEIVYVD